MLHATWRSNETAAEERVRRTMSLTVRDLRLRERRVWKGSTVEPERPRSRRLPDLADAVWDGTNVTLYFDGAQQLTGLDRFNF